MAARLLGRIGSASVAGEIAGILRASRDAGQRFYCATALGLLAAEEAVPILLSCLRDRNPRVRRGAATALGRIRAPQAVDALIHCLQDAAPDVRGGVATAL